MALIWSAETSSTCIVSYPWVCGRRGISTLSFESTVAEGLSSDSGWGFDFEAATEGGGY